MFQIHTPLGGRVYKTGAAHNSWGQIYSEYVGANITEISSSGGNRFECMGRIMFAPVL